VQRRCMKRKWWYETYFLYYSSYINLEVSQSLFFIIIIIVFFLYTKLCSLFFTGAS
jgi:hypothetical protein